MSECCTCKVNVESSIYSSFTKGNACFFNAVFTCWYSVIICGIQRYSVPHSYGELHLVMVMAYAYGISYPTSTMLLKEIEKSSDLLKPKCSSLCKNRDGKDR